MSKQSGSLSIRAMVEKVLAFSLYTSVMGFIAAGVISMCIPGVGIV